MHISRPRQAADKLGIGLSTLWYKIKTDPEFPKPLKLSEGVTGFVDSELDAYIESRVAISRGQTEKKQSTQQAGRASAEKRARKGSAA
jgi:prophage regulatory protein